VPLSLVQDLPQAVTASGRSYAIETDHRTGVRVALALEAVADGDIAPETAPSIILSHFVPALVAGIDRFGVPLYPGSLPAGDLYAACMRFHACADDDDGEEDEGEGVPGPRVFSWKADQERLVSDFQREYAIDLTDSLTSLHWWRFMRLFVGLGDTSSIKSVMHLRRRDIPSTLPPDQRFALIAAKRAVALAPRRQEDLIYYADIL
jgi:hypothetical protein